MKKLFITLAAGLFAIASFAAELDVPLSTPSPSPTPAQPTVIINNFIQQVPTVPATPAPQPPPVVNSSPMDFILAVERCLNDWDWSTLTQYTADGDVNYFGRRYTTNESIIQDMLQDQHTYAWSRSVYYPSTFTHEVSHEYSPHWVGPMLYDSLTIYSEVQEITPGQGSLNGGLYRHWR